MKRSEHLEPLSHDHYEGLLVAGRLKKGLSKEASPEVMAAYVAHFWSSHLAKHFQEEETLLPPLLAEIGATNLTERMVEEHRAIELLVQRAGEAAGRVLTLAEFARMLKAHIRFEERTLFPSLEEQVDEETLREVGKKLHASHREADLDWGPAFWE